MQGTHKALAVCLAAGFLISIILFILSLRDIDADEQALKYHGISKSLDEEDGKPVVYDQGKHFCWLGQYFIKYFNRFEAVEFSGAKAQSCISQDGVVILTSIRLMYKMDRKKLSDALFDWGEQDQVREYVHRLAQDAIRNACSLYSAEKFFAERGAIEDAILREFTESVMENKAYVEAGQVQFSNAKMPKDFEQAVVLKIKEKQDIDSAKGPERNGTLLDGQIKLDVAKITTQVDLKNATATAAATVQAASQEAIGIQQDFIEKAAAWRHYKETNGLTVRQLIDGYFVSLAMKNASLPVYKLP